MLNLWRKIVCVVQQLPGIRVYSTTQKIAFLDLMLLKKKHCLFTERELMRNKLAKHRRNFLFFWEGGVGQCINEISYISALNLWQMFQCRGLVLGHDVLSNERTYLLKTYFHCNIVFEPHIHILLLLRLIFLDHFKEFLRLCLFCLMIISYIVPLIRLFGFSCSDGQLFPVLFLVWILSVT